MGYHRLTYNCNGYFVIRWAESHKTENTRGGRGEEIPPGTASRRLAPCTPGARSAQLRSSRQWLGAVHSSVGELRQRIRNVLADNEVFESPGRFDRGAGRRPRKETWECRRPGVATRISPGQSLRWDFPVRWGYRCDQPRRSPLRVVPTRSAYAACSKGGVSRWPVRPHNGTECIHRCVGKPRESRSPAQCPLQHLGFAASSDA